MVNQINEVIYWDSDSGDKLQSNKTTLVPNEGDVVRITRNNPRKNQWFVVEKIMWQVHSHTTIAEVYVSEKEN